MTPSAENDLPSPTRHRLPRRLRDRLRISVDTGGTFTDVVAADGDGALASAKAPTRVADPWAESRRHWQSWPRSLVPQ